MHNHHAKQEPLSYLCRKIKLQPIRIQQSPSKALKDERLDLPPNPPNPIETSPLSLSALAIDRCGAVGAIILRSIGGASCVMVIVRCLAAALGRAGWCEVLKDESVGHYYFMVVVKK